MQVVKGIGTDIIKISRIAQILQRFKQRFLHRVFTAEEITNSCRQSNPAAYLAKRFAAKEAYVKAIGTGFNKRLVMKEINIKNDSLGKPYIVHNNTVYNNLSLSDDGEYAIAFVVLP